MTYLFSQSFTTSREFAEGLSPQDVQQLTKLLADQEVFRFSSPVKHSLKQFETSLRRVRRRRNSLTRPPRWREQSLRRILTRSRRTLPTSCLLCAASALSIDLPFDLAHSSQRTDAVGEGSARRSDALARHSHRTSAKVDTAGNVCLFSAFISRILSHFL